MKKVIGLLVIGLSVLAFAVPFTVSRELAQAIGKLPQRKIVLQYEAGGNRTRLAAYSVWRLFRSAEWGDSEPRQSLNVMSQADAATCDIRISAKNIAANKDLVDAFTAGYAGSAFKICSGIDATLPDALPRISFGLKIDSH